nr:metal ABC transporter substrate-binding protein [Falsirhodobacter deserti]
MLALGFSMMAVAAQAQEFKVATTFTVIADMARNVAGDAAEVVSITRPGAEIHGYEPTPRDIVAAQDADLILWNGLNLERWFEQFLSNLGNVPSVTVSQGVTPVSITGGDYDGMPNPHAWMSLSNAMIYVDNIRNAFQEHDPEHAEVYEANAAAYKQQLQDAIGPIRASLQAIPENRRWLVTCEGAFGYLARDYGLNELYLWPINSEQTGTPRQIRQVIDAVREHHVPAVFCESTVSQNPAKEVARNTDAEYAGMLYVDSLSDGDGPVPTYLDLLRVTSETIAKGLTADE